MNNIADAIENEACSRCWFAPPRQSSPSARISSPRFAQAWAVGAGTLLTSIALAQPNNAFESRCSSLMELRGDATSDPSLRILGAQLNAAGSIASPGPGGAPRSAFEAPAHCEVKGVLRERSGANGQRYAIKFLMRLPVDWNGRFIFQGGGGSNGNLGIAVAPLIGDQRSSQRSGLSRGYAVVSQDSGHDNDVNVDPKLQGMVTFGHDAQARRDYAHTSHELVTRVAKLIIEKAYGRPPQFSYFVGCSKGGQEGMMMAQRYPTYFNGILSVAPGFTLPKASFITETWDSQAIARVAEEFGERDRNGAPLLNRAFSDEDLAIVSRAVTRSCDELDGIADGLVQDFRNCTTARVNPALQAVSCTGAKTNACLTSTQVDALRRIHDGPRNAAGELLYADWPWDPGIGGQAPDGKYYQGWRAWKTGPYDSEVNSAINVVLGAAAASAVFGTPPAQVPFDGSALTRWALQIDLERDAWRIFHSNPEFPESSWDLMSADSLDRAQFRRNGGKLLLVHGVADPIFSINDTVRWITALDDAENGRAAEYARLFAVPGMAHCSGGPATDDYEAFESLVNWVEQGQAPQQIVARGGVDSPWPNRTRPLCPFPKIARYTGRGDPENAASFVCSDK